MLRIYLILSVNHNVYKCLLKDQTLHYKSEKTSKIINACVVLHNLCITYNVPEIVDV